MIGNDTHHAGQGGSVLLNSMSGQFQPSHRHPRTAASPRDWLPLVRRLILLILVLLIFVVGGWAQPQSSGRPLGQSQVLGLVKGGVASERLAKLVQQRGINFKPAEQYLEELREAGAEEVLLKTLRALQPRVPEDAGGGTAGPVNEPSPGNPSKQPTTAELVAAHLPVARSCNDQDAGVRQSRNTVRPPSSRQKSQPSIWPWPTS